MDNRSEIVTVRLSPQERRKLEMMATHTHRPLAQVLRLLIAQAEVADEPDIQLRPKVINAQPDPA